MIVDFLGQQEEFPFVVMHAYVDAMNLVGMIFDSAICEFLNRFRLPGKAKKIDRIMEKLAMGECSEWPLVAGHGRPRSTFKR